jgi:hypothetical protein
MISQKRERERERERERGTPFQLSPSIYKKVWDSRTRKRALKEWISLSGKENRKKKNHKVFPGPRTEISS